MICFIKNSVERNNFIGNIFGNVSDKFDGAHFEQNESENSCLMELNDMLNSNFLELYKNESSNDLEEGVLLEKIVEFWVNKISAKILEVIEKDPKQLLNILKEAEERDCNYPFFSLNGPDERQEFCDSIANEKIIFSDLPKEGGSILFYLNERAENKSNKTYNISGKGVFIQRF